MFRAEPTIKSIRPLFGLPGLIAKPNSNEESWIFGDKTIDKNGATHTMTDLIFSIRQQASRMRIA